MDFSSLPDRPGNPEEEVYGGVEAQVTPSSANATANNKGGAEGSFLRYVSCFICHTPVKGSVLDGVRFWMTSCKHVVCGKHDHKAGVCTYCKAEHIEAVMIHKGLPEAQKHLFETSEVVAKRYRSIALQGREETDRYIEVLEYQLAQLMVREAARKKEMERREVKMRELRQAFQEEYKRRQEGDDEIEKLKTTVHNLKLSLEANSRSIPELLQSGHPRLAPITEQDESFGDQNGHEESPAKRQRTEITTPRNHASISAIRAPRITFEKRSNSDEGGDHEHCPSPGGGVRLNTFKNNMSRFRLNTGTPLPQTPANAFGIQMPARPSTGMSRPAGMHSMPPPSHFMTPRPQVPMVGFTDRLRTNGLLMRETPMHTSSGMAYSNPAPQVPPFAASRAPSRPGEAYQNHNQMQSYDQAHENSGYGEPQPPHQHQAYYQEQPQPHMQAPLSIRTPANSRPSDIGRIM